tara:strand:- start:412 stop:699 length:288 start_codon:yes stop_codon:yes gene_type:complete
MNKVLSNLSESEMMSLFLKQEQESAIGDMHSQQQYLEYLDHEVLSVCTAMWGEVLAEKGVKATRHNLEDAFAPFFDVVMAKHYADSCELPFKVEE